jgi:ankyrin repeat protein
MLLKAGAEINSENSWKLTPINIALLKNHTGVLKKFLEYPDINVNGKDDTG